MSAYHLTTFTLFAELPELADVPTRQINFLCTVIHVFPPRFVERTKRNLQGFVIINEERRALILTLWEEFLQSEAPYLTKNVNNMPIVLGMRLSVNTFYGLSIGTIPSSTILFDPPISQAEDLRLWVKANRQYADTVISQRLYEKAYQSVAQPFNFQIRKLSQILSLAETIQHKPRDQRNSQIIYILDYQVTGLCCETG
ncbi:uncharacterized protein [Primulina huaijiensis]|uniref:uncharacterized protein isoform X2 n=1 Tax=Primulina huaijiensis TaxID=1492673 RepID=UPI003CC74820